MTIHGKTQVCVALCVFWFWSYLGATASIHAVCCSCPVPFSFQTPILTLMPIAQQTGLWGTTAWLCAFSVFKAISLDANHRKQLPALFTWEQLTPFSRTQKGEESKRNRTALLPALSTPGNSHGLVSCIHCLCIYTQHR